jgi:hypothetical protein
VTYPIAPLGVRIRAAVSGYYNPNTDPSTWPWLEITRDVDMLAPIDDTIGAPDDDSDPSTTLEFVLKQDASKYNSIIGRYTADNPESDIYPFFDVGCAIEYSLDVGDGGGWDIQCVTFIATLQNDWESHTEWRTVAKVTCVGVLQRGAVINQTQRSPMYRTITDGRNLGLWMFEDQQGSQAAASGVTGQTDMGRYGAWDAFEFGAEALVPGVASGAQISTGQAMISLLSRRGTGTGVRLGFLLYVGTNPATYKELISITMGNSQRYCLDIGPSTLRFRAVNPAQVEISGAAPVGFTDHLVQAVWCELEVNQTSAGTLQWDIRETRWRIDSSGQPAGSQGGASGTFASTLDSAAQVIVAGFADVDDVWVGAMDLTEPPYPASGGLAAVLGWAGNTAAGRVQGMCNELGLPSSVTDPAFGVVMGPQLIDSLRANLLDVRNTDHGVLSDHLGKVSYRTISELYNASPVFTLTRVVRGQLGEIPAVRDDTAKVNSVTVSRRLGESVTVDDWRDIALKGLYEGSPSDPLNLGTAAALTPHAGWYLARGISTEYRYSDLTMHMRTAAEYTPALAGQVASLQLGDRIAISSLPPQASKNPITRQVRGRKQTVLNRGMMRWDVTYSMVPIDAYEVFVLDTDRLDTAGSEVAVSVPSKVATTVVVATAGALPATGTGQSISLDMGGEEVLLTGVATEALGDTFTRSVSPGWGSMPASTNIAAIPWVSAQSANMSTNGTQGVMTVASSPGSTQAHLTGLSLLDGDFTATCSPSFVATGGSAEIQVNYRQTLTTIGYAWRITIDTTNNTRLKLFNPSSVAIADIPLSLVHFAGAVYGIRWWTIGRSHYCKVWLGGLGLEPVSPTIEVVDSDRLLPGYPILRFGRASGNTNVGNTMRWDDFTINNLQAFTVTRSQGGGVSKAQAQGNRVRLWRGRGLGI